MGVFVDLFSSFGLRSVHRELYREQEDKAPVSVQRGRARTEEATNRVFIPSLSELVAQIKERNKAESFHFSREISGLEERFINGGINSPVTPRVSSAPIAIKLPPVFDPIDPIDRKPSYCLDVAELIHRARSSTGATTHDGDSDSSETSGSKASSVAGSFSISPGASGYSLKEFEWK